MGTHKTKAKVRVTLRNGESLEIHDDLICRAFRETDDDIRRYRKLATHLADLVRASAPVLEFVVKRGSGPVEHATSCLEASRAILKQLDDGRQK
jgi:hypothetical protein